MIDTRAAGDLVSGVDALVGAALADGLGRPERAARAGKAAQAAADLAQYARMLDPYGDRRHSRAADAIALRWPNSSAGTAEGAAERAQRAELAAELRAWQPLTTMQGLSTGTDEVRPLRGLVGAPLLAALARPAAPVRPGRHVQPTIDALPAVTVDPVDGADLVPVDWEISGTGRRYTVAALAINISRQAIDWTERGLQYETVIDLAVLRALEEQLLSLLTEGLTAAAGLDAAEISVATATGYAPDTIVFNGADLVDVRTAYANTPAGLVPRFIVTPAATAGTAVVLASQAVDIEASDVGYMAEEEPKTLGRMLAATAHGDAQVSVAGAVATATI